MHVYGSIASPFVQRVLMAARLKGHELELRPVPGGSTQSPEFQAISPMGRIPLLALDDGRHICESSAIVGYLDETLDGPPLLPADPVARAHAREIESLALCEGAGGMRPQMVHLVFRMGDAPDIVAAARAQLVKGLDALERVRAPDARFAAGDAPGGADCLLAPFLALIMITDFATGNAALLAERPGLAGYLSRARGEPVIGRSVREMEEGFAAILQRNAAAA